MSNKIDIDFSKEWAELDEMLEDSAFRRRFDTALKQASNANGSILKKEIRKNILRGTYAKGRAPNAPLTTFIKGKNKPLVDNRDMYRAIRFRTISPTRLEVGVLRNDKMKDVVATVHNGAKIKVTKAMRGMFAALQDVSEGRKSPDTLSGRAKALFARKQTGWRALRDSTAVIKIPARPFLREVIENDKVQRKLAENVSAAASAAIVNMKPVLKRTM